METNELKTNHPSVAFRGGAFGALLGVAGVETEPDAGRRWLVPGALELLALVARLFLVVL